jgi:hypothetical protein
MHSLLDQVPSSHLKYLRHLRYFTIVQEMRDPFYTQLQCVIETLTNVRELLAFRDCYCNRTDVRGIVHTIETWARLPFTMLSVGRQTEFFPPISILKSAPWCRYCASTIGRRSNEWKVAMMM